MCALLMQERQSVIVRYSIVIADLKCVVFKQR